MASLLGFTLLELIIAIALISILATIGLSAYQGPKLKAKQMAAKTALFELAASLEQHRLEVQSYEKNDVFIPMVTGYTIAIVNASADKFLLAAKPVEHNAADQCDTFFLDQDGNQTTSTSRRECW